MLGSLYQFLANKIHYIRSLITIHTAYIRLITVIIASVSEFTSFYKLRIPIGCSSWKVRMHMTSSMWDDAEEEEE